MNIQALDQKAKWLAKNYIRLESELLAVIMEMDKCKAFYKLGYGSLFQYVTEGLKLSSGQAVPFVNVARKAIEVPELRKEVEKGLSIYKAQKMTSVLTKENQDQWFQAAKEKTHRQLEREVALASPRLSSEKTKYLPLGVELPEKVKYKQSAREQSNGSSSSPCLSLEMTLPEKTMLLLRRAQDLECQRQKRKVDLDEVFGILANTYLDKNDPVRKAKRQKAKGKLAEEEKSQTQNTSKLMDEETIHTQNFSAIKISSDLSCDKSSSESTQSTSTCRRGSSPLGSSQNDEESKLTFKTNRRRPLHAKTIHQVQLRDQGQCTYQDNQGKRCSNQRFLEIHHIHPVAKGGQNKIENLALLCSGHHKVLHAQDH